MTPQHPYGNPLTYPRLTLRAAVRVVLRGVPIAALCIGGLVLVLLLRAVLPARAHLVPARVTVAVCRASLRMMGMPLTVVGTPLPAVSNQISAVVANHASWLDIFVLNAVQPVYFVAKSEVAQWPFIGWLARATGTVFITRKRTEAQRQQVQLGARLNAGHRLLFFPEGTSTDSTSILPFKPTLFAALYAATASRDVLVQPASVIYTAPSGQDARFYGWWGDMGFAPHLLRTLAQAPQGQVRVVLHPPLSAADYPARKDLSAACEAAVRAGAATGAPAPSISPAGPAGS